MYNFKYYIMKTTFKLCYVELITFNLMTDLKKSRDSILIVGRFYMVNIQTK